MLEEGYPTNQTSKATQNVGVKGCEDPTIPVKHVGGHSENDWIMDESRGTDNTTP